MNLKEKTIFSGETFFTKNKFILKTVLGSCIGVVFWHPKRKITAIIHYVIPRRGIRQPTLNGTYGEEAFDIVLEHIQKNSLNLNEFSVFAFGGANMNPKFKSKISDQNIELLKEKINDLNLNIKHQDVGGNTSRHIAFDTETGKFKIRTIDPNLEFLKV